MSDQTNGHHNGQMRVLRISHSSLTPELRERERMLVRRHPEVSLEVVTASRWHEGGLEVAASDDDLFPVTKAPTHLSKRLALFAFDPRPIIAALRRHRPHLIDISQESYMLSCMESLTLSRWFAPGTKIVLAATQNILRRYPPPFEYFQRQAFRTAAAAYACSATVLEVLRAKGFHKPAPVIPFGVRLENFPPRPSGVSGDQPLTIGFIGRMVTAKGIFVLADALAALAGERWRALFVGDGPERGAFTQRLAAHGMLDRIELTGAVNYAEVPKYFQRMDVMVLPTLTTPTFREQFGRVLVEAMASQVCVIGSTCGSIPEVIGEAGLVFPEGDSASLAAGLRRLILDQDLRLRLSQRGRDRVEQHYTWEQVADQMYELYLEALKKTVRGA